MPEISGTVAASLAASASILVAFLVTLVALSVANRYQLVDAPNHRSSHVQPVPRVGGIGVLAGMLTLVGMAPLALGARSLPWWILAFVVVLAAVGFVDDLRSVSAGARLIAQVGAAVGVVLLQLVRGEDGGWLVGPVLALGLVALVNFTNFMDGINGLVALQAIVSGGFAVVVAWQHDVDAVMLAGAALACGSLGFLPWNLPTAMTFLGDVGSYAIGAAIGALALMEVAAQVPWDLVLAPLLVIAADATTTLVRRSRAGSKLTEAHRDHVYQRLFDRGLSHSAVSLAAAAFSVAACAAAALTDGVLFAGLAGALVVGYLSLPRVLRP